MALDLSLLFYDYEHHDPTLPYKFEKLRPHQVDAIEQIADAFNRVDIVFLNAPTGAGKTVIAEVSRRLLSMNGRTATGLYVCTDKSLQHQFCRDFDYARPVMGRANYPTELDPLKTADDCSSMTPGAGCWYCNSKATCPYEVAKSEAQEAELAVLNTAYMLAITNVGRGEDDNGFTGRDLCVIDEADMLEGLLQNYVGFEVTKRRIYDLSMQPPKKSVRKGTLVKWLESFSIRCNEAARYEQDPKKKRSLKRHGQEAVAVAREIQMDIDAWGDTVDDDPDAVGHWQRDYSGVGADGLVLKPALVSKYGVRYIWRHQRKFLLMSASLISPDEMAESLGIAVPYEVVNVPSTFPVENRPIIMAPIANVVRAEMDEAKVKLTRAIERICERHPGERILVHCVSYDLAQALNGSVTAPGFSKYTYTESREKERVLESFKNGVEHGIGPGKRGKIMFAASMDRGIDLPGDLCTVQIIAKVPYVNLGDRLVKARMSLPGGQLWATTQMVRSMVQMVGRGVRSETDKCVTYVLDAQFGRVWRQSRALLPDWFQDAVDTGYDISFLLTSDQLQ